MSSKSKKYTVLVAGCAIGVGLCVFPSITLTQSDSFEPHLIGPAITRASEGLSGQDLGECMYTSVAIPIKVTYRGLPLTVTKHTAMCGDGQIEIYPLAVVCNILSVAALGVITMKLWTRRTKK